MSQNYVVAKVEQRGTWQNKYGKGMQDWATEFEGIDGWVRWTKLDTSPAPEVGQSYTGYLTKDTKGITVFKQDYTFTNPAPAGQPQLPVAHAEGPRKDFKDNADIKALACIKAACDLYNGSGEVEKAKQAAREFYVLVDELKSLQAKTQADEVKSTLGGEEIKEESTPF